MAKQVRKPYFRDDEFLKAVGENVRSLRIGKGMTQMELAFACNDIDYSQINRIELGKINFTVSYISLLAKVLEVSPDELMKVEK